jgi:malonyl-CoA decarboxylase
VHPSITPYQRIIGSRTIFVYAEKDEPQFIVSAKYGAEPSKSVEDIMCCDTNFVKDCATFYSIFRVPGQGNKGMGGQVLKNIIDYCKLRGTDCFYTLSPIPYLKETFQAVPKEKELREYLLTKTGPVEKFHLGNGATIENINFKADSSELRMNESFWVMVNYKYNY